MTEENLGSPQGKNISWRVIQISFSIFCSTWLWVRAFGRERVPREGGALFLLNHESYLDPLFAAVWLPRPVSYLARDNLFKIPVIGWILRSTYVQSINREAASTASIRECVRRLKLGFLCGIFPEGTRGSTEEVAPFKPGFLAIVRRADVPVVPVGLAGAGRVYGKRFWFVKPGRVYVYYGTPISPQEILEELKRTGEEAVAEMLRQRVIECQQKAKRWLDTGRLE